MCINRSQTCYVIIRVSLLDRLVGLTQMGDDASWQLFSRDVQLLGLSASPPKGTLPDVSWLMHSSFVLPRSCPKHSVMCMATVGLLEISYPSTAVDGACILIEKHCVLIGKNCFLLLWCLTFSEQATVCLLAKC